MTTLSPGVPGTDLPAMEILNRTSLALDMHSNFHPADYAMFVIMMLLSTLIGVYYGCFQKQDSVSEYLLGGQKMSIFPMAMSLISSSVSGITMLGVPSDVYMYGTQFFMVAFTVFPAIFIVMYWFLPMFYKLQYTSTFEYLEHRFSRGVRQLASFLYALGNLLYLPIVVYVPCLALNQVSGISVHLISPIACIVCIFYTSLGGLKAVVWTDALQLVLLFLASIVVIILGLLRLGGFGTVWERAAEGGRLVLFDMDPSPYARCTFWNVAFGTFFMHLGMHGTQPSSVQRSLCVPSLAKARRTLLSLAVGYFFTKLLSVTTGLIIYATYYHCDPLHPSVGVVRKQDQLVPYYVIDVTSNWPGLSGLFVAGVFSAALSTMSAILNTLSGTLYKDFVEKLLPMKVSDERASTHMKFMSVAIGAFCVMMIFVVENLGGVLPVAVSLGGVTGGAAFGLFALGMFFPWVNYKGAFAGAIGSLIFMAVMVGGNSYAQASKKLYYPPMPTRTDGCVSNATLSALHSILTSTSPAPASFSSSPPTPTLRMPHDADVFPLFKISYFYFGFIGTFVTLVIGVTVSFFTGPLKLEDADPDLFSPAVARFLPRYKERQRRCETAKAEEAGSTPMKEYRVVPSTEN